MSEAVPLLDDVDALLQRLDRQFDDMYSLQPEIFVKGLAQSIDQMLNALLDRDEPGFDDVRVKLKAIRVELPAEPPMSLSRDEYDRLNTSFHSVFGKDWRLHDCWSEISEIAFMGILLQRMNHLERTAESRALTEDEINEMGSLPGQLDACHGMLAELRQRHTS